MTKLESYQKGASFAASRFYADIVGAPGEPRSIWRWRNWPSTASTCAFWALIRRRGSAAEDKALHANRVQGLILRKSARITATCAFMPRVQSPRP